MESRAQINDRLTLFLTRTHSQPVISHNNYFEHANKILISIQLDDEPNDYDQDGIDELTSQRTVVITILIVILIMTLCIVGPGLYMYYVRGKWTIEEEEQGKPEGQPLTKVKDEPDKLDETLLINRDEIRILHKIGQGQFGSVHFGTLTVRSGRLSIPVAIKMSSKFFYSLSFYLFKN